MLPTRSPRGEMKRCAEPTCLSVSWNVLLSASCSSSYSDRLVPGGAPASGGTTDPSQTHVSLVDPWEAGKKAAGPGFLGAFRDAGPEANTSEKDSVEVWCVGVVLCIGRCAWHPMSLGGKHHTAGRKSLLHAGRPQCKVSGAQVRPWTTASNCLQQ